MLAAGPAKAMYGVVYAAAVLLDRHRDSFLMTGLFVISISPATAPATAGVNIFITGRNFGTDSAMITVFISDTSARTRSVNLFPV